MTSAWDFSYFGSLSHPIYSLQIKCISKVKGPENKTFPEKSKENPIQGKNPGIILGPEEFSAQKNFETESALHGPGGF